MLLGDASRAAADLCLPLALGEFFQQASPRTSFLFDYHVGYFPDRPVLSDGLLITFCRELDQRSVTPGKPEGGEGARERACASYGRTSGARGAGSAVARGGGTPEG